MTANDLRLDILGASFSISADKDPAYLETVFNQYRTAVENTQNISGMKDPLIIAILTGFLLCDEINEMKIHTGEEQKKAEARRIEAHEVEQRTMNLIARLDKVLKEKLPESIHLSGIRVHTGGT